MLIQIGCYDPLSDDPQLGIQSVVLNSSDETLFVAGTTGHVVILHFSEAERRREVEVCNGYAACFVLSFVVNWRVCRWKCSAVLIVSDM